MDCVFSLKPAFDILIIEDNSPDGTAGIVKTLQKEFTNLHIIERISKAGFKENTQRIMFSIFSFSL